MQFPSPVPHSNNKSSTESREGPCSNKFISGIAVTPYFVWVPRPGSMLSATKTDARSKACSVDASEPVQLHTLSHIATPRNHWKQPAAGGGYRAHLRVVTENSFSLVVRRSNPRNRRLGRAWSTAGITLFSHFQMYLHAEAPQCRMHDSTEMYVSSWSLASVMLVGSVSGHHEEGLSPGIADKYSPLQITVAAFLTFSAGSVTGQLFIGRFADPSWIIRIHASHWNTDPTCSVWRVARCAEYVGISTHVRCGALPLQQCTVRIPSPAHRLRHLPPHPHAAQVSRCGQRQLRAAVGTTNRCHPLILRVALRPVRLQRPPVTIAILQLHAINVVAVGGFLAAITAVVECTTTDSALPRRAPCQHWQHQWSNAQHAP
ncbi:hypothetical protein TCDM_10343 [Trypanosoma cruzi Dm28c]|uniref:Uncharacterized protein n=1 Tax=Trypanosoma cruzi Dm28c TaxID=1416333 RepID=V5B341_TRYCR|nr:hypothetical protein TCDM_10343 [Trypanosoma cruzi Dm28c]